VKPILFKGLLLSLWIAVLFMASADQAQAITRRVPAEYPTIQDGINAAVDGDTVLVAPGTYENISFQGKAISVISEAGPQVTIIKGNGRSSVVRFTSGEGATSVLSGFTVQDGATELQGFNRLGGGIYINQASPKIIGNIIKNNTATHGGGGIGINGNASPLIQGNVITHNQHLPGDIYPGGGGISVSGGASPMILDNTITDNSSLIRGGGISLHQTGAVVVRNNKIHRNLAHFGGGLYRESFSSDSIVQNLITDNQTDSGFGGGAHISGGALTVLNNTIANNDSFGSALVLGIFQPGAAIRNNLIIAKDGQIALACLNSNQATLNNNNVFSFQGIAYFNTCVNQTGINGNISVDPLFVNPAAGDYHLRPGSPSIDAGDNAALNLPETDIEGNPRITDGNGDGVAVVDMGAYEAPPFNICIQDESNGSLLKINSVTGNYQFINCAGIILNGIGNITRRGSTLTLQHYASDRRVLATIDLSLKKASATIQDFMQGRSFTVTDRNTVNNTCTCSS
jgi:serine protease